MPHTPEFTRLVALLAAAKLAALNAERGTSASPAPKAERGADHGTSANQTLNPNHVPSSVPSAAPVTEGAR